MTDLEMLKLCAEAMDLRLLPAYRKGSILYDEGQHDWNGLMYSKDGVRECLFVDSGAYDPIHDDAQAMVLVKKLDLNLQPDYEGWCVSDYTGDKVEVRHKDLNRAIVECVARLQRAYTRSDRRTEPHFNEVQPRRSKMTTQVHIVNSSDSNPAQHAKVTVTKPNQEPKVTLLAPGESKAYWIGSSDNISVTEIFEPKPTA